MGALGNLVPLIILSLVVGGAAFVGYQIYAWSNEMSERGKKHMEQKNMSFTKEGGLKVGVKDVGNEAYTDKTQNVLVNAWNQSGYGHADGKKSSSSRPTSSQQRPSAPRTSSGASASGASKLSPPVSRSGTGRSGSPLPGSF